MVACVTCRLFSWINDPKNSLEYKFSSYFQRSLGHIVQLKTLPSFERRLARTIIGASPWLRPIGFTFEVQGAGLLIY